MDDKVIVLILGYKSINDLDECISSLLKQTYKNYEIWFADNDSGDNSVKYLNKNFPKVKTFQFKNNHGYAGGNNKLIKKAFEKKADFCLVQNADTKSDPNLIYDLISSYKEKSQNYKKVGLIQPLIMLADKPKKVNSMGNIIHYLGFGYCGGYMSEKIPKVDKEISSVSGTSMLISKNYYKTVGSFDEDFFMYNEDQDYSWRGLMMGYKHFLSVKSKVWHKYSFSKNKLKWYHSEKNRLTMMLKNYEKKTLLKLLPVLIFNEIAIMLFSLINGWIVLKFKSYSYIYKNIKEIKKKRKIIQNTRTVGDLFILKKFDSKLNFIEVNNLFFSYIINLIYSFYLKIIL